MENQVIKVSNLLNNMGMLAHAVNSGIKPTLEHQISRVWECVRDLAEGDIERKTWRDLTKPQEVFIEPVGLHAFIKLNSQTSALVAAVYHKHPTNVAVAHIKHYLEMMCESYSINHELIIKY